MIQSKNYCPCGSGMSYGKCCEVFHKNQSDAQTAEKLMRSRYCAYVLGLQSYIQNTWHGEERPEQLEQEDPAPTWLGLTIKKSSKGETEDEAFVEFIARFRIGGSKASKIHEVSRFVRENGRWYYVDGQFIE